MGGLGRAQVRRQYMRMPKAVARPSGLELLLAAQFAVQPFALDAALSDPQLLAIGCIKLGDGKDAGLIQPLCHALADAIQISQLQRKQLFR